MTYDNSVHYYAVLVICSVGCATNLINFLVFTRKKMQNALNTILTSLAVTHFLFLLNGLINTSVKLSYYAFGESRSSYRQALESILADHIAYYVSSVFFNWGKMILKVLFLAFSDVVNLFDDFGGCLEIPGYLLSS